MGAKHPDRVNFKRDKLRTGFTFQDYRNAIKVESMYYFTARAFNYYLVKRFKCENPGKKPPLKSEYTYVISFFHKAARRAGIKLKCSDLPYELIEAKRLQLKLKRKTAKHAKS